MRIKYNPCFFYSNSIIKNLENIARMEGELITESRNIQIDLDIFSLANIDAVHFSTKLEGNILNYEQVTQALHQNTKDIKEKKDLREIINYSQARQFLFEKAMQGKLFDKRLVLDIHKILMDRIVDGKLKGYYRVAQNVIRDSATNAIVYLPPEAKDVDMYMKSLLDWVNTELLRKTSPLVIAPIFHYYFVTIHPFIDGNGRLARLLTNYILHSHGYSISQYASIEKQHEIDRKTYYKKLQSLQAINFYNINPQIDITSWLEYWLACLAKAYEEALSRISDKQPQNKLSHLSIRLQKAYGLVKQHHQLKASEYSLLIGLSRTQSVADLNELVNQGFIEKIGGGRSIMYRVILGV